MPLIPPSVNNRTLREKVLLIAPPKTGKTSSWLSIAYWSYKTGDPAKFFVIDTDDAVRAVMAEEKYSGMDADDGGNVIVREVIDWEDYQAASTEALKTVGEGDWVVIDMVTYAWTAVQNWYVEQAQNKSRAEALMDASKKGASGWDLFREAGMDWSVINAEYDAFIKPLNLRSRANLFYIAEQETIPDNTKVEDQKAHIREFGKHKARGQKALPYQCRSYVRMQRLARGRVLFTLGDRARKEMDGEDMPLDFFSTYMKGVAGWGIETTKAEVPAET